MPIDFTQRIKANRKHNNKQSTEDGKIAPLFPFESDRGRIINSAAIRRLQQKTQVFPLERNAAVRSRLTHSLEVQQVGRYISQLIFKTLNEDLQREYGLYGLDRQFESIVEMSCLMHDVGNPPFGHFGEDTMIKWFQSHIDALLEPLEETTPSVGLKALKEDICNFEGNAQALRLVHTLLALNLTYSQTSGILKYTRQGDRPKPDKHSPLQYLQKKVGFYLSEAPFIAELRQQLSLSEGCRSPFAYVMEAADDISYGVADIEDAVEKGILSVTELPALLLSEYRTMLHTTPFALVDSGLMDQIVQSANSMFRTDQIDSMFFVGLRVGINQHLPKFAANQFITHIQAIFDGHFDRALIEDNSHYHAVVEALKAVARKKAFCDPEVEMQELQGFKIINGLLDAYAPLLALPRDTFELVISGDKKAPGYEARLFKKLPGKHIRAYLQAIDKTNLKSFTQHFEDSNLDALPEEAWEFYFRCRLIQDYISGMTDQFAYDEYRALHVIQ